MKRREWFIGILALAVVAAAGVIWIAPWKGEPAPAVTLTTTGGKTLSLTSLRGKPVLVTFWATDCVGCVEEIPALKALYRQYAPHGFHLIAIAMNYDPPKQVRAMIAEKHMPYTVALDSDGAASRAFGNIRVTPTSFLIDPAGYIVKQRLGNLNMASVRKQLKGMLGTEPAAGGS